MKKVYFLFLLCILLNAFSFINAQTVSQSWFTSYGTAGVDLFSGVTTDGSGNIFLTGSENAANSASGRATIVKYNAAGTMQWLVRYNGPLTYTETGATFTDGSGNTYLAAKPRNSSHSILALVKYNTNAQQQWVTFFDSAANLIIDPKAVKIDGAGNVYVAGTINSELYNYDLLIMKFNASGVRQWTRTFNGGANVSDYMNGMTVDAAGNVYVAGQVMNVFSIRGGSPVNNYDYVTLKYSTDGVLQWSARYGYTKTGFDAPKGISVDGSGNVYVTGYSAGSGTGFDYATVKYNSAGALQWSARFVAPWGLDDLASGIVVDGGGNIFVTGTSRYSSSASQIATVKYNSAGAQQWVNYYYGNTNAIPGGIGLDNTGNVYITGEASNPGVTTSDAITVKYNSAGTQIWAVRYNNYLNGSDAGGGVRLHSSSIIGVNPPVVYVGGTTSTGTSSDILLIKYTQTTGTGTVSRLALEPAAPAPTEFGVTATPNPSRGPVNIIYSIPEDAHVTLKIYDVLGKEVTTLFSGTRTTGQYQATFNTAKHTGQQYYYTLIAKSSKGDYRETKPLILMK